MTEQEKLYNLCKKFITDNHINCVEDVYQSDWVIEHAYELIEQIYDIIGYLPNDDQSVF